MSPWFPVASITYAPSITLPTTKPPHNDPPRVTQAAEVTNAAEEGLENAQVVSVGRKPLPLTAISEPIRPVPELSTITGADSAFTGRRDPA
jgi:hypothetical protein